MFSGRSSGLALLAMSSLCLGLIAADPGPQLDSEIRLKSPKTANGTTSKMFRGTAAESAPGVAVTAPAPFRGKERPSVRVESLDPHDPVQRFIVLTSGGPLILDVAIAIDGQPFRIARERLIDELLRLADTDGDGRPTWFEALRNPLFLSTAGRNMTTLENATIDRNAVLLDRNENERLDRPEARRYLPFGVRGEPMTIRQISFGRAVQTGLQQIFDADQDGILSAEEIRSAPARLKALDNNVDDWLDLTEITAIPPQSPQPFSTQPERISPFVDSILAVGVNSDVRRIAEAVQTRYEGDDGKVTALDFRLVPGLVAEGDLDRNGCLDPGEIFALLDARPHVVVEVNLGDRDDVFTGPILKSIAPELIQAGAVAAEQSGRIVIRLPGLNLVLSTVNDYRPIPSDFVPEAGQLLRQYDTDGSGSIERHEVEVTPDRLGRFKQWDLNADGEVTADEIQADYARQTAAAFTMIHGSVAEREPDFFNALDISGDGRLSLREIQHAALRLLSLDKNGDGRISLEEMPGQINLALRRGVDEYSDMFGNPLPRRRRPLTTAPAPDWFLRMDRNGDGDVSPREFLGTNVQFADLDRDKDGFIDRREAEAAANRQPDRK